MSYIEEIEKNINVSFENKELLSQAFMHRSFVAEHNLEDATSNERLEFLGDAVLELAVTRYLYETFFTQPEGVLTQWRAIIVNTKNLAETAKSLSITGHIFLSRGEKLSGGAEKDRILANILEALMGAIYLDQGYGRAEQFVKDFILQDAGKLLEAYRQYNPKGVLQEKIQASKRVTPEYRILEESGPDHSKIFLAGIFLDGKVIGKGKGVSKKEAEEEAARDALNNLLTLNFLSK